MTSTLLKGHVSPETAYIVNDYPYSWQLRCTMRYWIEYKAGKGCRLVSQTTNPKKGNVWNKPKASTYSRFGLAMYLDEKGHVHAAGLTEYSTGKEAKDYSDKYRDGVPEPARNDLDSWVAAKLAYDAARNPGDPLVKGLYEAHKAWLDVELAAIRKDAPNGP